MSEGPRAVGMVTARWWPQVGGIETHARQLARWLVGRGVRVEVLCLDDGGELEAFAEVDSQDGKVGVRRVAYRYQDHRNFADLGRNEQLEGVADGWARERGLDLVHIHHLTGWGRGLVGVLARIAPVVLTLHDYWMVCPRGQLWDADEELCPGPSAERCTPCLRKTWPHLAEEGDPVVSACADRGRVEALIAGGLEACGEACALLAPSESARSVLVQAGVPAERLSVFSLGVDCAGLALEVERLRAERAPRAERVIGVLGAVQPTKGVLELAQAIVACEVEGLRLRIHGPIGSYHGDSSYSDKLSELVALHEEIELCGPYQPDELAGVLAGLDAVAAPALWEEGFGLSVREAAAVGLPVLVSDAGGLPELVERDGAVGVVARRADPGSLVEALRWLDATDSLGVVPPNERPALVGLDMMCEGLAEVYAEVLAEQASQAASNAEALASQE